MSLKIPPESDYLRFLENEKVISDYIINHSKSMLSIINRNYIYEKVNNRYCIEHKIPYESVIGKSIQELWGSESFKNEIKNNIDLCFGGKIVEYESAFSTPRSGKRSYEVIFRPVSLESGKITHILAETFDIHDLKLSRQQVLEKEEELRMFETNLPIGFLRCAPDGRIIHSNKTFLTILGCQEEIHGAEMNMKSFYPDEYLFELHVDQLKETHSKSFGRISLINSKGNEIPCRISGYLAEDTHGEPSFIDFAIEDSSRELMLENRLLQAQKLETIGALAGGIAHDFNNILAIISGYSEMLQDDLSSDSALADKVCKIQAAVSKAQSITSQVLTFSRHIEQEKIPINVSDVLNETIGFVRSSVSSNISIKTRIPKSSSNVLADPTQLFRVFLNLMTNAIQSMEDEGGILSVSLDIIDGKYVQHELNKDIVTDEYVLVTFQDTGKGMDQSILNRIFEPFFTTRDVGKGTGLGLSVIHGIITEMEGEILVSSKQEKGSNFLVYLPVSKQYSVISDNNERRKKILFITGNKHESRVLSIALENSGYELIYISDHHSLTKVMKLFKELHDLIIYMSDSVQVQPEDLIGIFNRLKITSPCILITDNNRSILEEKLLNSGIIKQHLIKPVSLKEIRNAIIEALR